MFGVMILLYNILVILNLGLAVTVINLFYIFIYIIAKHVQWTRRQTCGCLRSISQLMYQRVLKNSFRVDLSSGPHLFKFPHLFFFYTFLGSSSISYTLHGSSIVLGKLSFYIEEVYLRLVVIKPLSGNLLKDHNQQVVGSCRTRGQFSFPISSIIDCRFFLFSLGGVQLLSHCRLL